MNRFVTYERIFEIQFGPVFWFLHLAKEAMKRKEYWSANQFINFGNLAFASKLADWKDPKAVPTSVFERTVLPKREKKRRRKNENTK